LTGAFLPDILLRQVPQQVIARVSSGECRVYGSIVRSMVTGRIVGHLQETAGLTNLAGGLLMAPVSLPLQVGGLAVDAVGHTVSYVQNEQIKAGIELLQSMQLASLAVGTIAIGVSVAGFAVLSKKLSRLEAKVDELEPMLREIGSVVNAIRADQISEQFVRLRTALEQLDEGWLLADPVGQWRHVAAEAHSLANQFHRRSMDLLDTGPAALPLAEPMVEALALAASARVTARMASGDDVAALSAARDGAESLMEIDERVRPAESAFALLSADSDPGTAEWNKALQSTAEGLKPAVEAMRARTEAASATCLTLSELHARQISCREWLDSARAEMDEPLLFLDADA
jgi:hypothetical protein